MKNEYIEIQEIIERVLHFAKHSHDDGINDRLMNMNDANLIDIYKWLSPLEQNDTFNFIMSAILASPKWPRFQGTDDERKRSLSTIPSILLRAIYSSRKRGYYSDYIRDFYARLLEFNFPVKKHGLQSQMARLANIVLNLKDCDITPQHIKKHIDKD